MISPPPRDLTRLDRVEFGWRVVIVVALLAAAALICIATEVFLMAFAAMLLAIFLDFLADELASRAGISHGWAFASVVLGIVILFSALGWVAIPRIANQVSQFVHYVPQSFEKLTNYLQQREWGKTILQYAPGVIASTNIAGALTVGLKDFVAGALEFAIFAIAGVYLGANPGLYEAGLVKLFPPRDRDRARHVFSEVAYALRWWVLGQLVPVTVLAIATGVGLWLMRMPLALTLGVFTGLMVFIPYIGSIIAYLFTLPVAMLRGPHELLYVTALYLGVHLVEGYLITPLAQRRAVYLPPGLTIMSQVLLGFLLGFFGLALATPLTAAALVLVKTLYLGETPEHHG